MYCDEKPSSHMKRLTMKHYDHCDFGKNYIQCNQL